MSHQCKGCTKRTLDQTVSFSFTTGNGFGTFSVLQNDMYYIEVTTINELFMADFCELLNSATLQVLSSYQAVKTSLLTTERNFSFSEDYYC